jgi:hypothetical protein
MHAEMVASNAYSRNSWSFQPFKPLNPFDPFEPLNPGRRRPMPKRPFENNREATLEEPVQIDGKGR